MNVPNPSPVILRERLGEGAAAPAWCARYVGIPFRSGGRDRAGCDCYGLVALVLHERFGLEVPSYSADYADATDRREIADLIMREIGDGGALNITAIENSTVYGGVNTGPTPSPMWRRVPFDRAARCFGPPPGSVILLRIAGEPWHIGVVVAAGWFLHVRAGTDSCLERYDSLRWRNRIVGFYRFA